MNEDKPVNLITCRDGFASALAAELGGTEHTAPGQVLTHAGLPDAPYIFERQRIAPAYRLPLAATKPLTRELAAQLLGPILEQDSLWTTHAWSADPADVPRIQGFEKAVINACKKLDTGTWKCWRKPEKLAQRHTGIALQLYRTEQALWHGVSDIARMLDPAPDGLRRMKMDADAPSRSYLKMEEALSYLGIDPQPGECVVDLGAAPGGWTWSFLKRGCTVTAVDNGPMKIADPEARGGHLVHVRADGISYTPETPVDWLVSDMLIPPGQVIGMLRKWIDNRWADKLVFNVKLPQQDMYAGLKPLQDYLVECTGGRIRIKQLYHDRREVTCFGCLKACKE